MSQPASSSVPAAPAARPRPGPRPASYKLALLLILGIIIGAEVVGEAVLPLLKVGDLSTRNLVLMGLGGTALLGLVAVNARWLWVTLGNLRFALALITVWGVASALGTLVVQRFPNQTDAGYARSFTEATGDFLYNMAHFSNGGVVVHPEPDVRRWLDEQYRLFGQDQGAETEEGWRKGEEQRLRAAEIAQYTADHAELLSGTLAAVSVLRLPEAFQISVWFKALLALLCAALVAVVIQRWRGEWRQIGWAMAHFGMVIFIIGATVRATHKVDGLLPMHVGETADSYYRNVTEAKGPFAHITKGKQTLVTPLDFQVTLHRFKTEYPKQLTVALAGPTQDLSKNYRVDKGWSHPFLDDQLEVHVDRLVENAAATEYQRDRPDGPPAPALRVALSGSALPEEQHTLQDGDSRGLAPPDNNYHLVYVRATDDRSFAQLTSVMEPAVQRGTLISEDGSVEGVAQAGTVFKLPGDDQRTLTVVAIWPDGARRSDSDGATAAPRDPVAQLELQAGGQRLGNVWVGADQMTVDDGVPRPAELRFDYDLWASPAPLHYRLVDRAGGPVTLVAFRDGAPAEARELPLGGEAALGTTGDRVRIVAAFERYTSGLAIGPAQTPGMTPEDVYYASLPTALELTLRGSTIVALAGVIAQKTFPFAGIVGTQEFERGEGTVAATSDGAGLRVRLLSDDDTLQRFPGGVTALLAEKAAGGALPFALLWRTNAQGAPLRFTSDVTLSKDGRTIQRGLVEPNRPIYLAGYQFSQADFDAKDPTYSAFGVVRDPSVHIVYFAMGVLVSGVILLFYLYPVFARRRGGRSLP